MSRSAHDSRVTPLPRNGQPGWQTWMADSDYSAFQSSPRSHLAYGSCLSGLPNNASPTSGGGSALARVCPDPSNMKSSRCPNSCSCPSYDRHLAGEALYQPSIAMASDQFQSQSAMSAASASTLCPADDMRSGTEPSKALQPAPRWASTDNVLASSFVQQTAIDSRTQGNIFIQPAMQVPTV